MSLDCAFEFQAPQFIESWEKAATIDDGADNFFDALESLETQDSIEQRDFKENKKPALQESNEVIQADSTVTSTSSYNENKIADEVENVNHLYQNGHKISDDIENVNHLVKNEEDNESRRLSLKRKASPLKDRNAYAPPPLVKGYHQKFKHKQAIQILPTIAESPVLLTKLRVRPKSAPEPEKRPILKPVRKKNIGVCLKPLPKPPTIPEPFNLTEAGKNVHKCFEEDSEKSIITPSKKPVKKKRIEIPHETSSAKQNDTSAFSFYERDMEIMRRKQERMNGKSEDAQCKFEFRAKSPSVLKKEPFRPELGSKIHSEPIGPELSTQERVKRREQLEERRKEIAKQKQSELEAKKMEELENSLFIFKAKPAPKSNSSFVSTTSSSNRNFFDTSVASSISVCDNKSNNMAFSFYERDKELLKRKEERAKQVESIKPEFKAKEATVLSKDPFWPEVKSRYISEGSAPNLATIKRAKEKKIKLEEKQKKAEAREKWLQEEIRKAEEEEIRRLRKAREFKATSIKK